MTNTQKQKSVPVRDSSAISISFSNAHSLTDSVALSLTDTIIAKTGASAQISFRGPMSAMLDLAKRLESRASDVSATITLRGSKPAA